MTQKRKCGYPLWVTKDIQDWVRVRAKGNSRTMGEEVAAIRKKMDELDKIVPIAVPVLTEKKLGDTL